MKRESSSGEFSRRIERKQKRKLKAMKTANDSLFLSFSTYGMIGWSITVPVLVGIALGIWLDRTFPGRHSYTLMLLASGLMLGCYNAWSWIEGQQKEIDNDQKTEEKEDRC